MKHNINLIWPYILFIKDIGIWHKQVNLMNQCRWIHWTIIGIATSETNLLSQAESTSCFEVKHVVFRDFIVKSAWDQFCILPRMKKSMALFHIRIFHVILDSYIIFKTSVCGSQVQELYPHCSSQSSCNGYLAVLAFAGEGKSWTCMKTYFT